MRLLRSIVAFLLAAHCGAQLALGFGVLGVGTFAVLSAVAAAWGFTVPLDAGSAAPRDRGATYRAACAWSLYALLVGATFAFVTVGRSDVGLLALQAVFAAELLFLARPDVGARQAPLLANSLALCCLGALTGPVLAAIALGGYAVLATLLMLADHQAMRRAVLGPGLVAAVGHGAGSAAVTVPLLWLLTSSPRAAAPLGAAAAGRSLETAGLVAGYGKLAVWGTVGVVLIVLLGRLLGRTKGEEALPADVVVGVRASEASRMERGLPPESVDLEGPRGEVIQRFLRFLTAARKLGYERRPSWTAVEFARQLPFPALRLARGFARARYSREEITAADARAAHEDAKTVLDNLKDR